MAFAFLKPETTRLFVLILLGGGYLVYHLVHWVRRWMARRKNRPVPPKARAEVDAAEESLPDNSKPTGGTPKVEERKVEAPQVEEPNAEPNPILPIRPAPPPPPPNETVSGEELFAQARKIPHQTIPDFEVDGPYLELLGRSAARGYAPAMAKLGEYAMRRAAWVEAYYWMSLAKRHGMKNLESVMREIRKYWSQEDFPNQISNVTSIFPPDAGSLGRALLHLDSGHEASHAREFLKANYPEFLSHE